jgi:hypothetical protein
LRQLLAADRLERLHTAPMLAALCGTHQLQREAGVGAALQRCVAQVAI